MTAPLTRELLRTHPLTGELMASRWRLTVVDTGRAMVRDAGTVVVGSHRDADLRLEGDSVSRYHAELRLMGDVIMVIDLESTNGTFVGKTRVERVTIGPGSTVRFGKIEVRFDAEEETLELPGQDTFGVAITRNERLAKVFGQLARVALTDATVLIEGDTGTGKGLVARAIHDGSPRAGAFFTLDCSAVASALAESALFGHLQGSFTGAAADTLGAFESAAGGTLFLDEIGELPADVQPKLLRALEERVIRPVGADVDRTVDVRFVAATHRDLEELVHEGTFRQDLFYRLAVIRASIPPLRDRPEDVALLAESFASKHGRRLSKEAVATLRRYDWPGNARELRNVLERAVVLATSDELGPEHLLPSAARAAESETFAEAKAATVEDFERRYVERLLASHDGNVSSAAREAGLSRAALYALLKRVGLR